MQQHNLGQATKPGYIQCLEECHERRAECDLCECAKRGTPAQPLREFDI